LYFKNRNNILLLKEDFVELIAQIKNESAKRHFGKIVTAVLKNNLLDFSVEEFELLAQTTMLWAVAPQARVAVQIWAFEIMLLLRKRTSIEVETINALLEIFTQASSPAMRCRIRRWKKGGLFS
jgi:hypothetical protein